jgi:hypothetical membrane protein
MLFTALVIVGGLLRPEYSHVRQFISELGATGTPNAGLFNLGGFVAAGLLLAAFGVATARLIPNGRWSVLAATLMTIFGCGVVAAGVYSCDPGCPQPAISVTGRIHDTVSIAAFVSAIAGIGLWALEFRRSEALGDLWRYSAFTSVMSLAFLFAVATSLESRAFTGLWQRLLLGTLFVWCGVVALRVRRLPESAHATAA